MAVTITVEWGDEAHSLILTDEEWATIVAGAPLVVDCPGYEYEGEEFQDEWDFAGGIDGDLEVRYGDGGVGWTGSLSDADITVVGA